MEIMLYTRLSSKRLAYIVSYIFESLLATKVKHSTNLGDFRSFEGVKINYSDEKISDNCLNIYPHPLLFEQDIQAQNTSTIHLDGCPIIFLTPAPVLAQSDQYSLAFDPFAASFYILTRYEEYLPFTEDQHGRYSAKLSWAHQNNCLHLPIIWEWTQLLKKALQQHFPNWQPQAPGYQFSPTYDIDIPWAFRYRSWRGWGRTTLDILQGNWPAFRERIAVLSGRRQDPYYVFDQLAALHQSSGLSPTIFWLLGDKSRYDINPSHRLPALQQLIQLTATWATIGIHPSYASFGNVTQITREKERLEEISSQTITHSRQHFLRLNLPATYRQLIAAGVQHDYTMGYADETGYRAGTTEAFRWYDLENEETTELWVHPFAVMDVTLKNYLKLSPLQAQENIKALQLYCQNQGLNFSTLWHNSSFSAIHGWFGWWEVYLSLFNQNQKTN